MLDTHFFSVCPNAYSKYQPFEQKRATVNACVRPNTSSNHHPFEQMGSISLKTFTNHRNLLKNWSVFCLISKTKQQVISPDSGSKCPRKNI